MRERVSAAFALPESPHLSADRVRLGARIENQGERGEAAVHENARVQFRYYSRDRRSARVLC
jgi:hypothetical protein